jgi:hypothetical protein
MSERRRSRRLKSFLRGFINLDKQRGAMPCMVRDLSDDGARIIFSETIATPDVVTLYIPQKDRTVRAAVQWRRGDEIGLTFAAAGRAADGPDASDLAQRVAQLETEIADLRQMLKRMKGERRRDDEAAA